MYVLGVLPALLTLWIRRSIPESRLWKRPTPGVGPCGPDNVAETLGAPEQALARFTLFDLFTDRTVRRRTVVVFLMSLSTTVGFWGISTWVPPFVGGSPPRPASRRNNGPAMAAWPTRSVPSQGT